MDKPLISMISVINSEMDELDKAQFRNMLENIEKQTYKNIEHVVILNFASNEIEDFLKKYNSIKVFIENVSSVADALNCGINDSSGDFVLFLDKTYTFASDDVVEKSILELQNAKADFSYSSVEYFLQNGQKYGKFTPNVSLFFLSQPFSLQGAIFNRKKILKLGGFDSKFVQNRDFDFLLRLILTGAKGVEMPVTFASKILKNNDIKALLNKKEYTDIYIKNYKNIKFLDLKTYDLMYKAFLMPKSLIDAMQPALYPTIQFKMDEMFDRFAILEGDSYRISKMPMITLESETKYINVFSKPVIKIVREGDIIIYYLFKLPFFVRKIA